MAGAQAGHSPGWGRASGAPCAAWARWTRGCSASSFQTRTMRPPAKPTTFAPHEAPHEARREGRRGGRRRPDKPRGRRRGRFRGTEGRAPCVACPSSPHLLPLLPLLLLLDLVSPCSCRCRMSCRATWSRPTRPTACWSATAAGGSSPRSSSGTSHKSLRSGGGTLGRSSRQAAAGLGWLGRQGAARPGKGSWTARLRCDKAAAAAAAEAGAMTRGATHATAGGAGHKRRGMGRRKKRGTTATKLATPGGLAPPLACMRPRRSPR